MSNIPFEENMHISEPLIALKFEEIFLYFVLNNHAIFLSFLQSILSASHLHLNALLGKMA